MKDKDSIEVLEESPEKMDNSLSEEVDSNAPSNNTEGGAKSIADEKSSDEESKYSLDTIQQSKALASHANENAKKNTADAETVGDVEENNLSLLMEKNFHTADEVVVITESDEDETECDVIPSTNDMVIVLEKQKQIPSPTNDPFFASINSKSPDEFICTQDASQKCAETHTSLSEKDENGSNSLEISIESNFLLPESYVPVSEETNSSIDVGEEDACASKALRVSDVETPVQNGNGDGRKEDQAAETGNTEYYTPPEKRGSEAPSPVGDEPMVYEDEALFEDQNGMNVSTGEDETSRESQRVAATNACESEEMSEEGNPLREEDSPVQSNSSQMDCKMYQGLMIISIGRKGTSTDCNSIVSELKKESRNAVEVTEYEEEDCDNIVENMMFCDESGSPSEFFMLPCPQKKQVRIIVERLGGMMVTKMGAFTIKLGIPRPSFVYSEEIFDFKYVHDCYEEQDLLDLKKYRLNEISVYNEVYDPITVLLRQTSWDQIKNRDCHATGAPNSSTVQEKQTDAIKPKKTSSSKPEKYCVKKRMYTQNERLAILDFICKTKSYGQVKGVQLWKKMERINVCPLRTYQSMRDHFLRYIMPRIHLFQLPEKEVQRIQNPLFRKDVKGSRGDSQKSCELVSKASEQSSDKEEENSAGTVDEELSGKGSKDGSEAVGENLGEKGCQRPEILLNHRDSLESLELFTSTQASHLVKKKSKPIESEDMPVDPTDQLHSEGEANPLTDNLDSPASHSSKNGKDADGESDQNVVHTDVDSEAETVNFSSAEEVIYEERKKPYTRFEEEKILNFIIKNKQCKAIGGNELWKLMESKTVLQGRSWQSMRERFKKAIGPHLNKFAINEEAMQELHVQLQMNKRKVRERLEQGKKVHGASARKPTRKRQRKISQIPDGHSSKEPSNHQRHSAGKEKAQARAEERPRKRRKRTLFNDQKSLLLLSSPLRLSSPMSATRKELFRIENTDESD